MKSDSPDLLASKPDKPKLTVIHGGSRKSAIAKELFQLVIQPELDEEKVAALEAALKPRGKLRRVV